MAEVMGECTHVPYHLKKLVLVLSAMRHFARALTMRGVQVRYVRLDDPDNTQTLRGEVGRAVAELAPRQIVVTEPGAHRVVTDMRTWAGPRDPPGHPLRLFDRRVSPLGERTQRLAHGVLLSRHAPPHRITDDPGR
jgi:deoxyribodipyrimidine photolyase-related protein